MENLEYRDDGIEQVDGAQQERGFERTRLPAMDDLETNYIGCHLRDLSAGMDDSIDPLPTIKRSKSLYDRSGTIQRATGGCIDHRLLRSKTIAVSTRSRSPSVHIDIDPDTVVSENRCNRNQILGRSEPHAHSNHVFDDGRNKRDSTTTPPDYYQLFPISREYIDTSVATLAKCDEKLARKCYDNLGFHELCSSNFVPPSSSTASLDLGAIGVTLESHSSAPGGLPTYKSLTEFLILDAPPNYEMVTGKKVEHDQVFVPDTSKTATRTRRAEPLTFGRKMFLIVVLVIIAVVTVALVAAQQLAK